MPWAMADKDKKKLKVILKLPKSSSQQKSPAVAAAGLANSSSAFAFSGAPTSQFAPAQDYRSKNVQSRHVATAGPGGAASAAAASSAPAPHTAASFSSVRFNASGSATSGAASRPLHVSSQPSSRAPTPPKKRKFKTVEHAGALGVGAVVVGSASAPAGDGPGSGKDAGGVAGGVPGGAATASPPRIGPSVKKSHKKQVKPTVLADGRLAHPFAGVILQPPVPSESLSKTLLEGVLDKLQKKDTYGVFAEPVDATQVPDYYDIIKEPMDFGTMRKKIKKGSYTTVEIFEGDIYLICSNAMRYNGPDTIYYKQARAIRDMARKALESIRGQLAGESLKPLSHKKKPPLSKKSHSKKPVANKVRFDSIGSDFDSGATLVRDGEPRGWSVSTVEASKAKKGTSLEKLVGVNEDSGGAWAVQPVVTETKADTQEEPSAAAALKPMGPKDGRRPLSTDEYHRNTYKQRLLPAHGQGLPLAAVGGELRQLQPVGLQVEHAYAKSLAQFGASFGPKAWLFVARKLQKVHAPIVQPLTNSPSPKGKGTSALPGQPGSSMHSQPPGVTQAGIGLGGNGRSSHFGQVVAATGHPSGASHAGQVVGSTPNYPSGTSQAGQVVSGYPSGGMPAVVPDQQAPNYPSGVTPAGVLDQIPDKVLQVRSEQGGFPDVPGRGNGGLEDGGSVATIHTSGTKQNRGMETGGGTEEIRNVGRLGWNPATNPSLLDQGGRVVTVGTSVKGLSQDSGAAAEDNRNGSRLGWTQSINVNPQAEEARNLGRLGWTQTTNMIAQDQVAIGGSGKGNVQDQVVRGVTLGGSGNGVSTDSGAPSEEDMNIGRLGWNQTINATAPDQGARGASLGTSGKGVAPETGAASEENMNASISWIQANVSTQDPGLKGVSVGASGKGFNSAWSTGALKHGPANYAYAPIKSSGGRDDGSAQAWAQAQVMSLTQQAEAKRKLTPVLQGFHPQSSQLKLPASLPQMLQPHAYAEYNNLISRLPSQQSTGLSSSVASNPQTQDQQSESFMTNSGEQKGMPNLRNHQGNMRPVPLQQSSLQQRAMPPDLNVALLSPSASALQSPPAQQGSTPSSAHQPDLKLQL